MSEAWFGARISAGLQVPLTAVAALMMCLSPGSGADDPDSIVPAQGPPFVGFLRARMSHVLTCRPDLAIALYPLVGWLWPNPERMDELPDPEVEEAAHAVARAAVAAGQLALTGTQARFDVDLLGSVLQILRTPKEQDARGQSLTPVDVSQLLVSLLAAPAAPVPGDAWHEPCVGTGSLFRSTAARLRTLGLDPRTMSWHGVDSDALALACCAINSISWGLGIEVHLAAANVLVGDHEHQLAGQRAEMLELAAARRFVAESAALMAQIPGMDATE